ncbi:hypothetical protein QJS10_CPA06g02015 [Acorus calamus]|uniref:cysteine dioxygenase n=1 Tax=Acorus calamus TaxID=4465 RepID=A0AAV9ELX0_ACOCL|nr:hypothetical protein QJS10_CPA06g02015 [Acorus calamus]
MEMMSKIQRLYDACNLVFSKRPQQQSFREIRWLQSLLDTLEAVDVGIDQSNGEESGSMGNEFSQITYIHIHQCDYFSIGMFCFPAGAKLPLHDHPQMTVLTKLLYGSVAVKAYDWVNNGSEKSGGLAGVAVDCVMQAPCGATVLFPRSGGNIHSFTALTPCAVLDVLSPPYSEELGRPSNYYTSIPIPLLPGYVILEEEKELPDDLIVVSAPYLGPELIVEDDEDELDLCS